MFLRFSTEPRQMLMISLVGVYEGERNIGARVLSQTFWHIFWYID